MDYKDYIFNMGVLSYRKGLSILECPFDIGTKIYSYWVDGWHWADYKIRILL